uniref:Cytochrome p450 n=1 Tax=Croton stellatopilosus TaxID=431156 RepID=A0A3G2CJU9_9ROSI|nr:cytochrome p450 [Croton stellatopilosus]
MHQLFGDLPQHRLTQLSKKYGPVMHLQLGEISNIVISSPEAAKQVMRTHDMFSAQRPYLFTVDIIMYGSKNIAFAPYGESWRQMRKICTLELLSPKRVRSFRVFREEETANLIRSIANSSQVNISRMVFNLSNAILFRSAFGKACEQDDSFLPIVQKFMLMLEGFSIVDFFPSLKFLPRITGMRSKLEKLHQEADQMIESLINEHREKKKSLGQEEDLVDILLNIQEQNNLGFPLTTESIKAIMMDMFIAGSETSAATIDWALSEMLKDSRVMKKAQAEVREVFRQEKGIDEDRLPELKYLKLVIREALRLHPPLPLLLPRESLKELEIDGYEIPKDTKLIVNASAIGRDARYWTEPDRFNPERFENGSVDFKGNDFEFIPFGAGRRMCPGLNYGMAVVESVLANLLYHFDWKLANGLEPHQLDMSESSGASARRNKELYLIPSPYNP